MGNDPTTGGTYAAQTWQQQINALAARVVKLEALKPIPGPAGPQGVPGPQGIPGPAGSGGTVDLTALTQRIAALEAKICPQQGVINNLCAKTGVTP